MSGTEGISKPLCTSDGQYLTVSFNKIEMYYAGTFHGYPEHYLKNAWKLHFYFVYVFCVSLSIMLVLFGPRR